MRAVAAVLLLLNACASHSQYTAQVRARDELVLSYNGRFELSADGKPIARGLRFNGLAQHVRCVHEAHKHAVNAEKAGTRAIVFSILGGVLGGLSLSAFAAFASPDTAVRAAVLASGVAVAATGTVFSALAFRSKNAANGSAIDAMNFYNDAVGSHGGSCDDTFPLAASTPASGPSSQPHR
jgi:hypothetical protein